MRLILDRAHLDAPCDLERGLAMSTIIASDEWWIEADHDGFRIGDLILYRATREQQTEYLASVLKKERADGDFIKGVYFGSVPAARVKCYRISGATAPAHAESEAGNSKDSAPKAAPTEGAQRGGAGARRVA